MGWGATTVAGTWLGFDFPRARACGGVFCVTRSSMRASTVSNFCSALAEDVGCALFGVAIDRVPRRTDDADVAVQRDRLAEPIPRRAVAGGHGQVGHRCVRPTAQRLDISKRSAGILVPNEYVWRARQDHVSEKRY